MEVQLATNATTLVREHETRHQAHRTRRNSNSRVFVAEDDDNDDDDDPRHLWTFLDLPQRGPALFLVDSA